MVTIEVPLGQEIEVRRAYGEWLKTLPKAERALSRIDLFPAEGPQVFRGGESVAYGASFNVDDRFADYLEQKSSVAFTLRP
jgi:hypothetical protein